MLLGVNHLDKIATSLEEVSGDIRNKGENFDERIVTAVEKLSNIVKPNGDFAERLTTAIQNFQPAPNVNLGTANFNTNGIYEASDYGLDGFTGVNVSVPEKTFNSGNGVFNANGVYNAADENLDGYKSVTVNVPEKVYNSGPLNVYANGVYNVSDSDYDGFNKVIVNVPEKTFDTGTLTVTQNGVYNASTNGLDGFNKVTVNVPIPVINLNSHTFNANGTYNAKNFGVDGFNNVVVNVPERAYNSGSKTLTSNGTYNANAYGLDGFNQVIVNVPGGGGTVTGLDPDYFVTQNRNGELVPVVPYTHGVTGASDTSPIVIGSKVRSIFGPIIYPNILGLQSDDALVVNDYYGNVQWRPTPERLKIDNRYMSNFVANEIVFPESVEYVDKFIDSAYLFNAPITFMGNNIHINGLIMNCWNFNSPILFDSNSILCEGHNMIWYQNNSSYTDQMAEAGSYYRCDLDIPIGVYDKPVVKYVEVSTDGDSSNNNNGGGGGGSDYNFELSSIPGFDFTNCSYMFCQSDTLNGCNINFTYRESPNFVTNNGTILSVLNFSNMFAYSGEAVFNTNIFDALHNVSPEWAVFKDYYNVAVDCSNMFIECYRFNSPLNIPTEFRINADNMFNRCTRFNQPIAINTGYAQDMFYYCRNMHSDVHFTSNRITTYSKAFSQTSGINIYFDCQENIQITSYAYTNMFSYANRLNVYFANYSSGFEFVSSKLVNGATLNWTYETDDNYRGAYYNSGYEIRVFFGRK